ncbi:MAG TPA: hypothetical protein VJ461_01675 [Candidatus Nanoarchaeia archaeon]|nr:hypothetical protein [Candidatus Nanoarchaeia archaeon]
MVEPTSFFPPEQPPPFEEHVRRPSIDVEMFSRVSKNVNGLAASLRIIEERYSNLRNRLQTSEQNIISLDKDLRTDIKLLSDEVIDLKRGISDIRDKLRLISGEVKNLVSKNDFKVMERYVEMWQPMSFVTRNELKKVLEEKKIWEEKSKTQEANQ